MTDQHATDRPTGVYDLPRIILLNASGETTEAAWNQLFDDVDTFLYDDWRVRHVQILPSNEGREVIVVLEREYETPHQPAPAPAEPAFTPAQTAEALASVRARLDAAAGQDDRAAIDALRAACATLADLVERQANDIARLRSALDEHARVMHHQ